MQATAAKAQQIKASSTISGTSSGKRIQTRSFDTGDYLSFVKNGVNKVMARIYAGRGLTPSDMDVGIEGLLPKESLAGCVEAGELLAECIIAKEKIVIAGDFDSDGMQSTSCMIRAIRGFGGIVDFVIPDRFREGYGLSPELARRAKDMGADCITTVDNGVASLSGVAEAKALSIKCVVTDHHLQLASGEIPKADCIVNPNMKDSKFGSRALAGVGVAFYVIGAMRASLRKRGWHKDFMLGSLLDMVSCGTIGDVVPLDRNNLILVRAGIEKVRSDRATLGIAALLAVSGKDAAGYSAEVAAFSLVPRINAAGRMESADIGVRLMTTDDMAEAIELATMLNGINIDRKRKQMEMTEDAMEMIDAMGDYGRNSYVVYNPTFHEGVVGLVASKVKDKFNRPSAAFTDAEDGNHKGSFRSIPGVHVRDVIDLVEKRNPGITVKYGGHAMAGGALVKRGCMKKFIREFDDAVLALAGPDAFSPTLETDGQLSAEDITLELAHSIQMGCWGQGVPPPVFIGEFQVMYQKVVGSGHMKVKLSMDGRVIDGIMFWRADPLPNFISAVYRIGVNEWQGERSVQVFLEGLVEP